MEGRDNAQIDGEKTMTGKGSSIDKSAGDESGSIQQTVKNQVEQVSKKVNELLGYYRTLDDVGKQLLASSDTWSANRWSSSFSVLQQCELK